MSEGTQVATFADYVRALLPWWLRRGSGGDMANAMGLMEDARLHATAQAVKVRIVSEAPPDALPALGWERDLERYPGDTDTDYRTRLRNAHATYRKAGSDAGVRDALIELGLSPRIKRNNNWDWDGHPGNPANYWARLWVILDTPHDYGPAAACGAAGAVCGAMLCGIASVSGRANSVVADELARMVRLVRKWKSSHAQFVRIIIRFASASAVYLCGDAGLLESPSAPLPAGASVICGQGAAYIFP